MTPGEREELEQQVAKQAKVGDIDAAATAALRAYGPEVLGFLVSSASDEDLAVDAFSLFSEDLWRGIGRFRWEATLRTWAYTLARHALSRAHKSKHRAAVPQEPLTTGVYNGVAQQVRTETLAFLRTGPRKEIAALRSELSEDEQMLLILRIDRGLKWREIARIMGEGDQSVSSEDLDRGVVTLRKRFERTKNRLRTLAKQRVAVEE